MSLQDGAERALSPCRRGACSNRCRDRGARRAKCRGIGHTGGDEWIGRRGRSRGFARRNPSLSGCFRHGTARQRNQSGGLRLYKSSRRDHKCGNRSSWQLKKDRADEQAHRSRAIQCEHSCNGDAEAAITQLPSGSETRYPIAQSVPRVNGRVIKH